MKRKRPQCLREAPRTGKETQRGNLELESAEAQQQFQRLGLGSWLSRLLHKLEDPDLDPQHQYKKTT